MHLVRQDPTVSPQWTRNYFEEPKPKPMPLSQIQHKTLSVLYKLESILAGGFTHEHFCYRLCDQSVTQSPKHFYVGFYSRSLFVHVT